MENVREEQERLPREYFCCCSTSRSYQMEEIPLQDMAPPAVLQAVDVQQEVAPVAQQPINQAEAGIPSPDLDERSAEEVEREFREWEPNMPLPKEFRTFIVVVFFLLFIYLTVGQALKQISYEIGWRDDGSEIASTPETDVTFNINPRMSTTLFNANSSGYNATASLNG